MNVFIAGGGVAGLEALFALRDLAADRVHVTLASPTSEFVYKPLTVLEPFAPSPAPRLPLDPLVDSANATFLRLGLRRIKPDQHIAELDDGSRIEFDAAIICVGAKPRIAFGHAVTLQASGSSIDIDALLRRAAAHASRQLLFVVPSAGTWPLPIYELALMAERRACQLDVDVSITIVTPERDPLAIFGRAASAAISSLLAARRIEVRTGAHAHEGASGPIVLEPNFERLDCGAVVALPELQGPAVPTLPADQRGFIPIDDKARVIGVPNVYAAGDGADFPIKHGSLGAQQADAAAEQIAADAGAPVDPAPFHPVIRGKLITGNEPLNLQADIADGVAEESVASARNLWWPPQKIAGKHLIAELTERTPHELGPPPDHATDVEVSLGAAWHGDPMAFDSR